MKKGRPSLDFLPGFFDSAPFTALLAGGVFAGGGVNTGGGGDACILSFALFPLELCFEFS